MKHRYFLFGTIMALLSPVGALAQQGSTPSDGREIVVTARSIKDTADALAACLARKCPPDQDVAASLAHAENQFLSGAYADARSTLLRSIGRNRKQGAAYPIPVSDLFRANSRIAEHMGEAKDYQRSVLDMRDTLKKGLGEDDARSLVAQTEVGDSRAKLGYPDEARRIYQEVEKRAIALNQPRVAMFARLRIAILTSTQAEDLKSSSERARARALLGDIIANPLPGASEFGLAARILLARFDRGDGKADTTADIVREFASKGGADRPILLVSEPIKQFGTRGSNGSTVNASNWQNVREFADQWVDIGFWVNADGRTSDAEVLRGTKNNRDWLKPVFDHLKTRVYAPLKKDGNDGSPGFYMIERYTLTARYTTDVTGSRMRQREATMRIERLDITPEDYAPPASTASADSNGA